MVQGVDADAGPAGNSEGGDVRAGFIERRKTVLRLRFCWWIVGEGGKGAVLIAVLCFGTILSLDKKELVAFLTF
jgi:hypothetical protein